MSLTTVQSLFQYAIASLGQAFTPACAVQNGSDFVLTYTNSTTLVDTVLTLNVDYTVTGAATNGVILAPTVTLEASGLHYAVGGTLTIQRKNPFTQPTVYVDGVKYLAAVPNNSLDWLAYSIQALNDIVARCLQVPASSAAIPPISRISRALKITGFDANGAFTLYDPAVVLSGAAVSVGSMAVLKAVSVAGLASGYMASLAGFYAAGDGGGGTFVYNSSSVAADNGGTIIQPTTGVGRWLRVYAGEVNIRWFGCVGDGVTDDTANLRKALIAGDGVVAPAGNFLCTAVVDLKSNNILRGVGDATIFTFSPGSAADDRLFRIDSTVSAQRAITGAIAIGATSFVASAAPSTADLVPGDWVQVYETDHPGASPDDVCNIDWMQVLSVAGTTVNVVNPFRTAFSGTHVTYGFSRIAAAALIQNVVLRDLSIVTRVNANVPIGINVNNCRHVLMENVKITVPTGANNPPVLLYRSSDVTLLDCLFVNGSCDLAASVDMRVESCFFGAEGTVGPFSASLTLEAGCGFFKILENTFLCATNIMLNLQLGGHDGIVRGNTLGWVSSPLVNLGVGISIQGFQRVLVDGNILAGGQNNGATTGNDGIATSDTTTFAGANLLSADNLIVNNIVKNFLNRFSIQPADLLGEDIGNLMTASRVFGSALALTTGAVGSLCTLTVPIGTWDVWGVIYFTFNGATTVTYLSGLVGLAAADGVLTDGTGILLPFTVNNGVNATINIPVRRVVAAAATPVYLNAVAGFAVNTCSAWGYLFARKAK